MLVKHETNGIINQIDRTSLVKAFSEAVTLLRDTKTVYSVVQRLLSGSIDVMSATDTLEDYVDIDYQNLALFNAWKSSEELIVNKYLERLICTIKLYNHNLLAATDCLFNITGDELSRIEQQVYSVISGLTFFCAYEFNILDIITTSEEGSLQIDEIVNSYCEQSGEDPVALAKGIQEDMTKFRVKFDVFDSFKELEDEFLCIMGPSIIGVDESILTREMVEEVIAGSLSPDELVERISAELAAQSEDEVEV